jgi:hypothetical protein
VTAGLQLLSLRVIRRLPPNVATMVNARRCSAGRRRISLEGGNRGSEALGGVVGDGYGDLMPRLGREWLERGLTGALVTLGETSTRGDGRPPEHVR